jgi:hypothetical protein
MNSQSEQVAKNLPSSMGPLKKGLYLGVQQRCSTYLIETVLRVAVTTRDDWRVFRDVTCLRPTLWLLNPP